MTQASDEQPVSFFSRISQDASNAFQDAYGNIVLGDDAGKSARLVVVLRPKLGEKIELGMTFIEINGRAYVRTVAPDSQAARAGVLPRDAIQFASVYQVDFDDMEDVDLEESATSYALECESRGMRISYEELRRLLADGLDPMQSAFLSPPSTSTSTWSGPPIPSTINVCAPPDDDYHRPLSPFRGETPKPVVFCFRRTRQRSSSGGLNFRLDDECDFASSLIRKLAPTADMEAPNPDTWDELVHDGTDWLLGRDSMLPPAAGLVFSSSNFQKREEESGIPLDDYERRRAQKLANLRERMAQESLEENYEDDVEAATIRGMIQKAVGLAFVRASKIVLGVSIHGGSGIVISRLNDGTWSAPSAIGTWGLGFGLQFGLEVAEYIFILQTQESLDHFRKGSSFNIGGNVGAAVAGMGREAYGAASVGTVCASTQPTIKEDEYNDDDTQEDKIFGIAPIVAYAKSQGLYVGVSLEGSRIFTRNDVNARAYKFATGREVTAKDILSGKVATPPEAEDLYAALHSVEFTHEMSCLPRPPEILRKDSAYSWHYNRSTLGHDNGSPKDPFPFLNLLSMEEAEECESFETQFKKFMYGGVSVQRLLLSEEATRSGKTRKERRTLWLMLPEVGALRLGFVSKLSDGEGAISNKSSTARAKRDSAMGDYSMPAWEGDLATVASEEVTLDSALLEKDPSTSGRIPAGDVQLSAKHSVALTDVTMLSQEPPNAPIAFSSEDKTEHLRVISIQDVSGTTLLFLANNFREAELLVCGLKLLLERETARLGVRGGLPISALGGKVAEGAMSPAAARGFKEPLMRSRSKQRDGYESSVLSSVLGEESTIGDSSSAMMVSSVPEGRKKWGNVPGRNYLRERAAAAMVTPSTGTPGDSRSEYGSTSGSGSTKYLHGQLIVRDICTNIQLPLPLPLCRVLLLDSSSPVIEKWEEDRGDKNFSRTDWTFPPATPRELERHASEHQLIASGSMMGAHRTTTFDRLRNGSLVHLSETQIIDADDSEKLAFTISERMPRRGFSIKVKVLLRSSKDNSCEATVLGEVRPVGKNMTNQAAVHKAFLLVLNEIKMRYGSEGKGLMASFLHVVSSLPNPESAVAAVGKSGRKSKSSRRKSGDISPPFRRTAPKKSPSSSEKAMNGKSKSRPESGLVSFDDIMNASHDLPPPKEPVRKNKEVERPATPSLQQIADSDPNIKRASRAEKEKKYLESNEFAELPVDEQADYIKSTQPKTIEVKPLPKIRLSLMPAPREEDEEDDSERSGRKKKKKSSRRKSTNSLGHSSSGRSSHSSSRRKSSHR